MFVLSYVCSGRRLHDAFERIPLGFHPDMEIVPENFLGDVAHDLPDRFLAGAVLCKLSDQRMTMVVPPARHLRILPNVLPRRLDRGLRAG